MLLFPCERIDLFQRFYLMILSAGIVKLRQRFFGGPAGSVFRGMAVLATGSIAARLIGVAVIPVLTRIYGPEDFGVLAVFTGLVAMLVPVLTLRYVVALPLPRHDGMAMNLLALSFGIMVAMAIAIGLMLWAFGPMLLGFMSMEVLVPWRWLMLAGLVGAGAYEIMSMWATRKRAYKTIARTQFTQSLLGAAVKVGLGFLAFKPFGLLVGQIAAQTGGIGVFSRQFLGDFRINWRHVDITTLKFAAKRYVSFPIYRLPSQFLMVFSQQAPLLFAAALYDAGTAGQLALATMALTMPLTLITEGIGKAYFAEIAKVGKRDPKFIHAITVDTTKKMLALAVLPTLTVAFFAPWVFSLAFGDQWVDAGVFARILSINMLFLIAARPTVQVMAVYDINAAFLLVNILRATLIIILSITSLIMAYDIVTFVSLYAVLMTFYYIFIMILVLFITRSRSERA